MLLVTKVDTFIVTRAEPLRRDTVSPAETLGKRFGNHAFDAIQKLSPDAFGGNPITPTAGATMRRYQRAADQQAHAESGRERHEHGSAFVIARHFAKLIRALRDVAGYFVAHIGHGMAGLRRRFLSGRLPG